MNYWFYLEKLVILPLMNYRKHFRSPWILPLKPQHYLLLSRRTISELDDLTLVLTVSDSRTAARLRPSHEHGETAVGERVTSDICPSSTSRCDLLNWLNHLLIIRGKSGNKFEDNAWGNTPLQFNSFFSHSLVILLFSPSSLLLCKFQSCILL